MKNHERKMFSVTFCVDAPLIVLEYGFNKYDKSVHV